MNVALFYEGASGGFYALWHLLLGTDLKCTFVGYHEEISRYQEIRGDDWPIDLSSSLDNVSQHILDEITGFNFKFNNFELDAVYNRHWDVLEKSKWKDSEVWPSNEATSQSDIVNKLYFYCNPNEEDFHRHKHDIKIYVYTDIETQIMFAKNKHAWMYNGKNIEEFESVKTPQTTKFNGCEVYHQVAKFAEYTDYQIRLQDVVNTQGQALLDIFNEKVNEDNIFHNNMWLNLHTDEEKGRLLNES